jgi:hypothetical protein
MRSPVVSHLHAMFARERCRSRISIIRCEEERSRVRLNQCACSANDSLRSRFRGVDDVKESGPSRSDQLRQTGKEFPLDC